MTKTSHVDSPWTRLKWTRKFPIENLFNPLQPPPPSVLIQLWGITCERQLRALNMSKNTKHVNVMVVSRGVIILSLIWKGNRKRSHKKWSLKIVLYGKNNRMWWSNKSWPAEFAVSDFIGGMASVYIPSSISDRHSLRFGRSRWLRACNSHTKPMSRHFRRLIYF